MSASRCRRLASLLLASAALVLVRQVRAQEIVQTPERVIQVARGASALLVNPTAFQRFSIGDPGVAEAVVVSPTELLINGKALGTTSLLLWENDATAHFYSVQVAVDAPGLQAYLRQVLDESKIEVNASGSTLTLTGEVRDPTAAEHAADIAKAAGATVIDNLSFASPQQVLLHVRIAEVNRSLLDQFSSHLTTLNPHKLDDNGNWTGETVSDGQLSLSLINPAANFTALLKALRSRGALRDLAEPNLLTLPGKEASFLAGGEFPYPSLQPGSGNNAVVIVFKEFGIKLKFTPTLTRNGMIRLKLAPEVSALDFGNALTISGFTIPSLTTRRAETEIELREGQHLTIAGLLDNATIENVSKIPLLGDIPILGKLFRSKDVRQRRTELVVIVTPSLVSASDTPPPLPTGEPDAWGLDESVTRPMSQPADSARRAPADSAERK